MQIKKNVSRVIKISYLRFFYINPCSFQGRNIITMANNFYSEKKSMPCSVNLRFAVAEFRPLFQAAYLIHVV